MTEHYLKRELYDRARSSDEILEWLERGSLDGIWYWDLEHPDEEWMSAGFKALFGYEDHEVPNTSAWWQANIFPEDLAGVLEAFDRHVGEGTPYDQVVRFRHKDGSTVWVRCRGLALKDDDGRPVRMLGAHTDVTARKEREERWRFAVEAADLGVWHWNVQSGSLEWSDQCKKLFGVPLDETMSFERFLEALHPDDRDPTIEIVKRSQETREPYATEYRAVWPDGSVHWLAAMGKTSYDEAGNPLEMKGVVQDIDARKRGEQLLQESEERLRLATDGAGTGIWYWDVASGEVYWSDTCRELFGVAAEEEITYERYMASVHPDDRSATQTATERALQNGENLRLEYRVVWPDGSVHWIAATGGTRYDAAGKPMRMEGVVQNIDSAKQNALMLQESEERFRATFEQAAVGIAHVGTDGAFLRVNERFGVIAGYSAEELLSKSFQEITHPDDLDKDIGLVQDVLDGKIDSYSMEKRYLRKRGAPVWVKLTVSLVKDASGRPKYFISVIEDISDKKKGERQLERLVHNLARSNEELQQYAYVASHDLQEPLRMVTSYLQLIERRYKGQLDAEADEFIHYAVDGAQRMKALISDLLSLSRIDTRGQAFELTDMRNVVDNARQNLKVAIEEAGATVLCGHMPQVSGDPAQLDQLLQNLIGNALKYRGEAPPRIEVSAEPVCGTGVQLPDTAPKTGWLFAVRDNGIGIDPGYSEQVFRIFKRLHSASDFSGSGIGLAMCKKIVERHGGSIWVESREGAGSTFYFALPPAAAAGDERTESHRDRVA